MAKLPDHRRALTNYHKRSVDVEKLFVRTKKLLYEQLGRAEEAMFPSDGTQDYDPKLAKEINDLSKAVTSVGQMFFKIQHEAKQANDALTLDERIEAVCDMIRSEGRINRSKIWKALWELEHELNSGDRLR